MLFHEVYGKYYQTVAKILRTAAERGTISRREIRRIVSDSAFSESTMFIPEAIQKNWFLLKEDGEPVLRNSPADMLTMIEKRWMKSLLRDPAIRLFQPSDQGLEDVEALFSQESIRWFDRYEDGDPYEDPEYIENFRHLTQAIIQKREVKLLYSGSNGEQIHICIPYRLEYSVKDNKFRLLAVQKGKTLILNLSRIRSCERMAPVSGSVKIPTPQRKKLILELWDNRNALERAMLNFSYLEKETVPLEKGKYQITLWYEPRDEREILIQILSFGPMMKVVAPDAVVSQIRQRIEKQKNLRTL